MCGQYLCMARNDAKLKHGDYRMDFVDNSPSTDIERIFKLFTLRNNLAANPIA